jgi:hypothetical protein
MASVVEKHYLRDATCSYRVDASVNRLYKKVDFNKKM